MRKTLFVILAVFLLHVPAVAVYEEPDLPDTSIEVFVSRNQQPVEESFVRLYDIGFYDESAGDYVLDPAFDRYDVDMKSDGFASDLWACFRQDGMAMRRSGLTDLNGRLSFDSLDPGMYLIALDNTTRAIIGCLDGLDSKLSLDLNYDGGLSSGSYGRHVIANSVSEERLEEIPELDMAQESQESEFTFVHVIFIILAIIVFAICVSLLCSFFGDVPVDSGSENAGVT